MQSVVAVTSRKRNTAGTVLIIAGAVLLLASATAKLAQVPQVVNQLGAAGFSPEKVMFVALLEIASALLFLVPATRSAGLLLVSAFLGGAIATHLQHSESIVPPSMVLFLIWLGAWLRHPEVLWSRQQSRPTEPLVDSPAGWGKSLSL
jgi:DoxX-like family